MSDEQDTVYDRARKAAGLDRVGDHTDDFMARQTEESNISSDLRLKMRYKFVCGRLETNPDERHLWEKRRHELEEELMQHDIRPSTLLD